MTSLRAVAIVLALAAIVAFVPTGGDVADVAGRAVSLGFLAVLAYGGVFLYRNQQMAVQMLDPRFRAALYGAIAVLVFCAAGYAWLTATTPRALVFAALVAVSLATLVLVWQRSRDLS